MVAEKRLNSLFCEIMESILIIDASKGTIIWTNPHAYTTFGFAKRGLEGKHFSCLFPPGAETEATSVLNEIVCADGIFLTQSFQRSDGHKFYMDLMAALIPWEGESSAILAVLREASERKQLEELRFETERLRSLSELSAGVAHHFNNMLQVIIGFAGLAQTELETGETSRIKHKLDQIIVSSYAAADAIKSLQDFARCGESTACLQKDILNLKILAQRAVDMSRLWLKKNQTEESGIVISIETDLHEDCYISVNHERMLEVMISLIKNGVESLVKSGTVTVGVTSGNGDAVFYVRDTGVGIKEVDLKRIFDPFWTTKGPRKSGFGLPSALGIVKRNGGEIVVETTEFEGSNFKVKFPLSKLSPESQRRKFDSGNGARVTSLIIDDEEKILESLRDGLEAEGHCVLTATTVREGLEILDTAEVDIIICDASVQDMSGWDLGRALKDQFKRSGKRKPHLILLTGWGAEQGQGERMARAGVDALLAKPISIENLIYQMKEILSP